MRNYYTNNANDMTELANKGFKYVIRTSYPQFAEEECKVLSRHKTYSATKKSPYYANNTIDDVEYLVAAFKQE